MAIVSVRIMMFYNWNGLILVCDEFIEFILIEIIWLNLYWLNYIIYMIYVEILILNECYIEKYIDWKYEEIDMNIWDCDIWIFDIEKWIELYWIMN